MRASGPSMKPRWQAREAKTAATGKKPGGRPPAPPVEGPLPTDQVNLTDEESRIMPVAGGGFEQCYNAQAAVAAGSLLVIAADVVQAPNDKQQLEPMLGKLADLPDELGEVEALLADNGYFSEGNVNACAAAGIDPLIAMGREAASSIARRALRGAAAVAAEEPDAARGDGASPQDARGQEALRLAQADARAGIRHHQIGARVPPVPAAWARQRPRRVEPRDHGLEHEADVRPGRRELRPIRKLERQPSPLARPTPYQRDRITWPATGSTRPKARTRSRSPLSAPMADNRSRHFTPTGC